MPLGKWAVNGFRYDPGGGQPREQQYQVHACIWAELAWQRAVRGTGLIIATLIVHPGAVGQSCNRRRPKRRKHKEENDLALAFADTDKILFASASGKGIVSRDRQLIHRLWGPYCDVFFDGGPGHADVAVIQVLPARAEYWGNDKGKVAMAVEKTKAYFTDGSPDLGENAKLSFG